MKKNELRYYMLGLFFVLGVVCMQADEPSGIIVSVLEKGDGAQLCNYLASDAELVVLGKSVARQQRCVELSRFFETNAVKQFSVIHKGTKQDACFIVGTLETARQNYRINMFVRNTSGDVFIQQLRIEKDN